MSVGLTRPGYVFAREEADGSEQVAYCRKILARLLPRCQQADRAEIGQEALVRFYASPPNGNWYNYLEKIIENLVSDYLSSNTNTVYEAIDSVAVGWDDEFPPDLKYRQTVDGHRVVVKESTTDAVCNLRNSYQRSDSRNRLLVELDVEGEDHADIAERLGYSEISKVTRQLRILRSSGRYWKLWLTAERLESLERAVERKASYAQIAQALEINPEQARYLKNKVLPTLSRSSRSMSAGEDAAPQSADSRSGRDLSSPSLVTSA